MPIPPPPEPVAGPDRSSVTARPRRRTQRARATALAALAAAAIAACSSDGADAIDSTGGTDDRAGEAEATTTTGPGLSDEAEDLVDDYSLDPDDCTEVPLSGAGAVTAVSCDLSPVTYELTRFEDRASLRGDFAAVADENEVPTRRWWYESAPDEVMGQMFSLVDGAEATIHWTNEAELVLGRAARDGADTLDLLEEWWGSDGSVAEDPVAAVGIVTDDCVALPASGSGGDPEVVSCTDGTAEARVIEVHGDTTEPECPADADRTWSQQTVGPSGHTEGYSLCLETLVDPATDGVLDVGSCVEAVPTEPGKHDVTEQPCEASPVTHEVTASVAEGATCPAGEPLAVSKSDAEIAASGPGDWCLAAR